HYIIRPILLLSSCPIQQLSFLFFLLFHHAATTHIYTLSLHDALPILAQQQLKQLHQSRHYLIVQCANQLVLLSTVFLNQDGLLRSEEHTSELQSRFDLVCRLLLEKKKRQRLHGSFIVAIIAAT